MADKKVPRKETLKEEGKGKGKSTHKVSSSKSKAGSGSKSKGTAPATISGPSAGGSGGYSGNTSAYEGSSDSRNASAYNSRGPTPESFEEKFNPDSGHHPIRLWPEKSKIWTGKELQLIREILREEDDTAMAQGKMLSWKKLHSIAKTTFKKETDWHRRGQEMFSVSDITQEVFWNCQFYERDIEFVEGPNRECHWDACFESDPDGKTAVLGYRKGPHSPPYYN